MHKVKDTINVSSLLLSFSFSPWKETFSFTLVLHGG